MRIEGEARGKRKKKTNNKNLPASRLRASRGGTGRLSRAGTASGRPWCPRARPQGKEEGKIKSLTRSINRRSAERDALYTTRRH
jgi:hypothetical protein